MTTSQRRRLNFIQSLSRATTGFLQSQTRDDGLKVENSLFTGIQRIPSRQMDTQERTDGTRKAVLEAVCRRLGLQDEGSVRIADICQETGLSSSVIYNNFRSRRGLIDAAYLEIYASITLELVAVFKEAMSDAVDRSSLSNYIEIQLENPSRQEFWRGNRHTRRRIATAAITRPSMPAEFAILQDKYLSDLSDFFEDLQQRHVAGNLLTPRQLAIMFEGRLLFHSFDDIAWQPAEGQSWLKMFMAVLGTVKTES
jgi:AcrR family transcriptional regulator